MNNVLPSIVDRRLGATCLRSVRYVRGTWGGLSDLRGLRPISEALLSEECNLHTSELGAFVIIHSHSYCIFTVALQL
jgi:hypothetical protein